MFSFDCNGNFLVRVFPPGSINPEQAGETVDRLSPLYINLDLKPKAGSHAAADFPVKFYSKIPFSFTLADTFPCDAVLQSFGRQRRSKNHEPRPACSLPALEQLRRAWNAMSANGSVLP
ncbi:hypothetical protein BHE74_00022579 [Ensete ventricosum]|nr:hypothetical protein BHE74_00022579 [Ensete ventricosum]